MKAVCLKPAKTLIYLYYSLLCVVMGACAPLVPATTPPQLAHTPGAFVVVTDKTFDAGMFRRGLSPIVACGQNQHCIR